MEAKHRVLDKLLIIKNLIDEFQKKTSGQFSVRIIGNPKPSEREFFTFESDAKYLHAEAAPEGALMSEKKKVILYNKAIDEKNKSIDATNISNSETYLQQKIRKVAINYKPNGRDLTNIEDALHHIESKVSERTFKDYKNIWVVVISDGKHDSHRLKSALSFNAKNEIELFLIGWEKPEVFNNVSTVENFESIDGFISYFKTIKCK